VPHLLPTLLLVEDDRADADLTMAAIQDFCNASEIKLKIEWRRHGEDGLEYLRSCLRLPKLILLDLNMPRMNGLEFLEQVRQQAMWRSIPIVVLTSSAREEEIEKAYGWFCNAYLQKPVDIDHFEALIAATGQFWLKTAILP